MSSHPGDDTESDVLGRESYHGDHEGWLTLQVRERGTKEIEMRANRTKGGGHIKDPKEKEQHLTKERVLVSGEQNLVRMVYRHEKGAT